MSNYFRSERKIVSLAVIVTSLRAFARKQRSMSETVARAKESKSSHCRVESARSPELCDIPPVRGSHALICGKESTAPLRRQAYPCSRLVRC